MRRLLLPRSRWQIVAVCVGVVAVGIGIFELLRPRSVGSQFVSALVAHDTPEFARLLANGADPNQDVEILHNYSAARTMPLLFAVIEIGEPEMLDALARHNVNFDVVRERDGAAPLPLACQDHARIVGGIEMAERLIALGVPVDSRDSQGKTALMAVCGDGDAIAAGVLIRRGADVMARTEGGVTALHFACGGRRQGSDCVHRLIEHGADVNARTESGWTALHFAALAEADQSEAIRLLLKRQADPYVRDLDGATPAGLMRLRPVYRALLAELGVQIVPPERK